ncbi:hypothetical protein M430DRAFT_109471, partial [Amorphotheca resinae ATCC 22711]
GKLYNLILVIIDRFIKFSLYILITNRLTSDRLASLLIYYVIRQFRILDSIVLD